MSNESTISCNYPDAQALQDFLRGQITNSALEDSIAAHVAATPSPPNL